jgi:hypothetical protein
MAGLDRQTVYHPNFVRFGGELGSCSPSRAQADEMQGRTAMDNTAQQAQAIYSIQQQAQDVAQTEAEEARRRAEVGYQLDWYPQQTTSQPR